MWPIYAHLPLGHRVMYPWGISAGLSRPLGIVHRSENVLSISGPLMGTDEVVGECKCLMEGAFSTSYTCTRLNCMSLLCTGVHIFYFCLSTLCYVCTYKVCILCVPPLHWGPQFVCVYIQGVYIVCSPFALGSTVCMCVHTRCVYCVFPPLHWGPQFVCVYIQGGSPLLYIQDVYVVCCMSPL